jgi:hypothetical protein
MGWMSVGFAQNDTNRLALPAGEPARAVSPSQATPAQATSSFPTISAGKDFPSLPLPERDAAVIKRQPPKLRLSPWTSEVVKLAESGVEPGVILAFIENSGTFNLGADQIVYLNDLGLSGEIINAMLQHDREVITGARPLTITSEPEWQFSLDPVMVAERRASDTPLPKPAAAPIRTGATAYSGSTPAFTALPELNRPVAVSPLATTESALLDEPATATRSTSDWQARSADRKKSPYPMREPYPVEITAPIVFINGEGRIPNTLVVLGFPRTTP